jgi:hypothetical protein
MSYIDLPKLPKKKRQEKGSDVVKVSLSLPAMTFEMLERVAKSENKTVSAVANYYIWNGYHVLRGTYVPPKKQNQNIENAGG